MSNKAQLQMHLLRLNQKKWHGFINTHQGYATDISELRLEPQIKKQAPASVRRRINESVSLNNLSAPDIISATGGIEREMAG